MLRPKLLVPIYNSARAALVAGTQAANPPLPSSAGVAVQDPASSAGLNANPWSTPHWDLQTPAHQIQGGWAWQGDPSRTGLEPDPASSASSSQGLKNDSLDYSGVPALAVGDTAADETEREAAAGASLQGHPQDPDGHLAGPRLGTDTNGRPGEDPALARLAPHAAFQGPLRAILAPSSGEALSNHGTPSTNLHSALSLYPQHVLPQLLRSNPAVGPILHSVPPARPGSLGEHTHCGGLHQVPPTLPVSTGLKLAERGQGELSQPALEQCGLPEESPVLPLSPFAPSFSPGAQSHATADGLLPNHGQPRPAASPWNLLQKLPAKPQQQQQYHAAVSPRQSSRQTPPGAAAGEPGAKPLSLQPSAHQDQPDGNRHLEDSRPMQAARHLALPSRSLTERANFLHRTDSDPSSTLSPQEASRSNTEEHRVQGSGKQGSQVNPNKSRVDCTARAAGVPQQESQERWNCDSSNGVAHTGCKREAAVHSFGAVPSLGTALDLLQEAFQQQGVQRMPLRTEVEWDRGSASALQDLEGLLASGEASPEASPEAPGEASSPVSLRGQHPSIVDPHTPASTGSSASDLSSLSWTGGLGPGGLCQVEPKAGRVPRVARWAGVPRQSKALVGNAPGVSSSRMMQSASLTSLAQPELSSPAQLGEKLALVNNSPMADDGHAGPVSPGPECNVGPRRASLPDLEVQVPLHRTGACGVGGGLFNESAAELTEGGQEANRPRNRRRGKRGGRKGGGGSSQGQRPATANVLSSGESPVGPGSPRGQQQHEDPPRHQRHQQHQQNHPGRQPATRATLALEPSVTGLNLGLPTTSESASGRPGPGLSSRHEQRKAVHGRASRAVSSWQIVETLTMCARRAHSAAAQRRQVEADEVGDSLAQEWRRAWERHLSGRQGRGKAPVQAQQGHGQPCLERSPGQQPGYQPQFELEPASKLSGVTLLAYHVAEAMKQVDRASLAKALMSWAQREQGVVADDWLWCAYAGALSRAGDLASLKELEGVMRAGEVPASIWLCNKLLNGYKLQWAEQEAGSLFEWMKNGGATLDVSSYTVMMDFSNKRGKYTTCVELFEEMVGAGLEPDQMAYTTVMGAHGRLNDQMGLRRTFDNLVRKGISPNTACFNTLIYGYSRVGNVAEAQRMYDQMLEGGVKPDQRTYSIMLDMASKQGNLGEAEAFFEEMESQGLKIDGVAWGSMVQMHSRRGDIPRAKHWFRRMLRSGCEPTIPALNSLLFGFAKLGMYEECQALLGFMHRRGHAPSLMTYSLFLSQCTAARTKVETQALLGLMGETRMRVHDLVTMLLHGPGDAEAEDFASREGAMWRTIEDILDRELVFGGSRALDYQEERRAFTDATLQFLHKFGLEASAARLWGLCLGRHVYNGFVLVQPQDWRDGAVSELNLHFMSHGTGLIVCKWALHELRKVYEEQGLVPERLNLITGWGKRSRIQGVPVLRHAVEAMFNSLGLEFNVVNLGCFYISGADLKVFMESPYMQGLPRMLDDKGP